VISILRAGIFFSSGLSSLGYNRLVVIFYSKYFYLNNKTVTENNEIIMFRCGFFIPTKFIFTFY